MTYNRDDITTWTVEMIQQRIQFATGLAKSAAPINRTTGEILLAKAQAEIARRGL